MNNVQLYLAIGVPIVFNGLMFTVLAVMATSRIRNFALPDSQAR